MERCFKFLAVLAAILSVGACIKLNLQTDKTDVQQGKEVTLTLDITNFKPGSVIKWVKVNEGLDNAELASNHILDQDYIDRDYELNLVHIDGSHYQIIFNIKAARLEDAGVYRCTWSDSEGESASEITINVIQAPQIIKFYFDGKEVGQDDEVDVEPDSTHSLKCEVLGGAPAPQVNIFAGHKNVSWKDEFVTDVARSEPKEVATALYQFTYNVTVEGKKVTFDSRFANKMVKCTVKGPGGQMSSAAFKAKFPGVSPEWSEDCPKEVLSFSGERNLKLACSVTSSPPAEIEFVWHYRNPAATDEFRLSPDTPAEEVPVHYNAKLEEVDESTQKAILIMDVVKPQMFRNYTFHAKNDVGEATYVVTLERDLSKILVTDGAVSQLSSATTFLALLTTAIYFLLH